MDLKSVAYFLLGFIVSLVLRITIISEPIEDEAP